MIYNRGSQLGVRVPLGVREKLTGGTQNFKNQSKQVHLGRIFELGVREGGTILIWGYVKGVQFWFGGIFLIRGYPSTKRLRTPDLQSKNARAVAILQVDHYEMICLNFKAVLNPRHQTTKIIFFTLKNIQATNQSEALIIRPRSKKMKVFFSSQKDK